MAVFLHEGWRNWRMSRDEQGFRSYDVTFLVEGSTLDGPANALQCPGLPIPGNFWFAGLDIDIYVWCRLNAEVEPVIADEPNNFFLVTFHFSNKIPKRDETYKGCEGQQIEDPLLIPQQISGSSVRYTQEESFNNDGTAIVNSAFELLRGPQVEFDRNRSQVNIEQNVPVLELDLCEGMRDKVNSAPMWNLNTRCVKLSNFTWERKFYGLCYVYYTRKFTFDIRADTFDRTSPDEGTKVIKGKWDTNPSSGQYGQYIVADGADPENMRDFIRFKDFHGENSTCFLNGRGFPVGGAPGEDFPGEISIQVYEEADFFQLGLPTSF